ncbi:MAG: hypothetical protein BJ554DRAFT_3124 [Olpidium bornovanus]|uniref:Uncharacterized protein n=1 Tax=Olpidium bornovanus TaxID=278681 RepID=A0A8H8DLN3_9FUNG|nr:MAG: hypothetical protein BJ554DRAFT_3124 [Olpidium bornovanus]
MVSRLIDKAIRRSRAIDTEGLCIVAGEKVREERRGVWSIRVDLHFLDHDGNIADCACIAAITGLLHFRRPDVSVIGEEVTIVRRRFPCCLTIRAPRPLEKNGAVFFFFLYPRAFLFAETNIPPPLGSILFHKFFLSSQWKSGIRCPSASTTSRSANLRVVDPCSLEERIQGGSMTIAMNVHKEICCVSKSGGIPLDSDQVNTCVNLAYAKVAEVTDAIKAALGRDARRK